MTWKLDCVVDVLISELSLSFVKNICCPVGYSSSMDNAGESFNRPQVKKFRKILVDMYTILQIQ